MSHKRINDCTGAEDDDINQPSLPEQGDEGDHATELPDALEHGDPKILGEQGLSQEVCSRDT